ncbi:TPA: hypothetical protein ACH3X2_004670 [Trebouxia sp. C0005]
MSMWQAGAPVRSGQHNAEVLLSLKDTSAQRRQQQPSAGTIQLIMHVAAAHVTLPISTVASKQLPVWEAAAKSKGSKGSFTASTSSAAAAAAEATAKQQQQQQALHAAFHPAASVDSVPLANRLVLSRLPDPVLNFGGQRGRAGMGHPAPTLMDLGQQQSKFAVQVNSGSLLAPRGSLHANCRWYINLSCACRDARSDSLEADPASDNPVADSPSNPTIVPLQPVLNPNPVQVISWDPCRPWKGPAHQSGQLDIPLYLQGPLWGQHHLSLGVWGWSSQPAHQLVVKQAGLRLRLIRSFATKHPLALGGFCFFVFFGLQGNCPPSAR